MCVERKKCKIFISFSFLDEKFALLLAKYLTQVFCERNFDLYCAALNNNYNAVKYGTDFSEDFIKNVNDSDVFIPLLSFNYKNSISSVIELGAAIGASKTIAPLILPGCDYSDFNTIYNLRNRDFYSIEQFEGVKKLFKMIAEHIQLENFDGLTEKFIEELNSIKETYIAHIAEISKFSFCCDTFNLQEYKSFIDKLKKTDMLECSVMVTHNNKVSLCNLYLKKGYHLTDFKTYAESNKIINYHITLLEQ